MVTLEEYIKLRLTPVLSQAKSKHLSESATGARIYISMNQLREPIRDMVCYARLIESITTGHEDRYKITLISKEISTMHKEGDKLTTTQVGKLFQDVAKQYQSNKDYYVGITNNPDRRESEHNAEFLVVVEAKNISAAKRLEQYCDDKHFDAGDTVGNVHKKSSKKVYIYKKTKKTKEHN